MFDRHKHPWFYWKYYAFVNWLSAFDSLRLIPKENVEYLQCGYDRYTQVRDYVKAHTENKISNQQFIWYIKGIVGGKWAGNAAQQKFQRRQDLNS